MNKVLGCIVLFSAFGSIAGCGSSRPEGLPVLYPTTVKVVQGGEPLADASVTLVPEDSSLSRWPVGSRTDSTGAAKLITYGQYDGAPAGKFKVTVNKVVTEGDAVPSYPGPDATPEQLREYDRALKTGNFKAFKVVNTKFRMPNSTPLNIEIAQSGPNEFTLDVGTAVKDKDATGGVGGGQGGGDEYQSMGQ